MRELFYAPVYYQRPTGEAVITIHMDETRESWYAAKTLVYNVVVKNPSAEQLANVDKATPLTLAAQADGKITVTFNFSQLFYFVSSWYSLKSSATHWLSVIVFTSKP